jgi:endoribonuclease LACTB2
MSKIIDAVSIVITCGDELFAIQRQYFLKAFPGYWAFPGGKVEKDDEQYFSQHELTKGLEPRLIGAAVREAKEELGIDLSQLVLSGVVERIDYFGLAITPDFNPYRFATYFFRFNLRHKVNFIIDRNEAMVAQWISSAQLLAKYNQGNVLAVPPVIKVIEELGTNPDIKTIEDLNFSYDGSTYVPCIESLKSVRQLMPLSNTLPPATRTNAFLLGDEGPKVLVDPSPRDNEEYRKLKNTINLYGLDKILLTHHHPDHHQLSTELAREFKVPMLMSADTNRRLLRKIPGYFEGVKVELVKEGDIVTSWLGRDVVIYEIPGHDEGQIALAAQDLSWFIAGDLFQGIGTVVIGDEEGDMKKYFDTLEKIIILNPRAVFPSHGIGLGGTSILERTLEHRKTREQQILQLHINGLTEEEMLKVIYAEIDERLWPYAKKNISKHLEKLRNEGRI